MRIEQVTETPLDNAGQPADTWSTYITRFAALEPLTGRELFTSQQRWPEVEARVKLYGDSKTTAITSKMRINANGTIYNILAVINKQDRGREVELMIRAEG